MGTKENNAGMDHRSFRDQLVFSIGLAVGRSRDLSVKEHVTDVARHELAERVVRDLEQSGFELDEEGQALRRRPPTRPHGVASFGKKVCLAPTSM